MHKYQLKKQERSDFCVPAVFQGILSRYSFYLTQTEISRKVNYSRENKTKIDEKADKLFELFGLKHRFYWYNEVPMKVPELLIDEWVEKQGDLYFAKPIGKEDGHAVLVTSFDKGNITYLDPEDTSLKNINLEDLYDSMNQIQRGGFGLVTR